MAHIISDITISQAPLTDDAFNTLLTSDSPTGYTAFQPFVQGDYEYQTALFRISMNSTSGDRGVINKLSVVVDVPDMFDSGDNIINGGTPTRITFARPFHVPPRVTLTVQSASDACTAKLVAGSVTRQYFDCYLERSSDQAMIDGALTWAAHAY
jgi:hypothetical protein